MMAAPIPVDEDGNPIAPAAPAAPTAVGPAAPVAAPPTPIPVDENGQPVPHDWFESYIRPNLPGFLTSNIPVTNPQGNLQPVDPNNSADQTRDFVARSVLRAAPITAWPNAAIVGSQVAGDYLNRKLGVTPADAPAAQPFNPLETFIDKAGIGLDPKAGLAAQTADSVAPWLVPGANTASRVAEATGPIAKVIAGAGSTAMGGVDWAVSNAAQDWARQHGYGPLAQTVASIAAPLTRGAMFRGAGAAAHAAGGTDEGSQWYDYNREEGRTPSFSEVVSPAVQELQKKAASLPYIQPALYAHMLFGPYGSATATGISTAGRYLANAVNDPSVVRAFADRGLTTPLIQQYASRAALGADAQAPPTPLTQTIMNYLRPGSASP